MPASRTIDISEIEAQRSALVGHCYRKLGSAFDAEDAVQETIVRAWQHADRFEERSSLQTWLYRIATNVCLDALSSRSKRARPAEDGPLRRSTIPSRRCRARRRPRTAQSSGPAPRWRNATSACSRPKKS